MGRLRVSIPLNLFMNNHLVGRLIRESSGGLSFSYDQAWLSSPTAIPVSLSLPLAEETYRGDIVFSFFDNLLPDSDILRRHIAERVGAKAKDAFSLLSVIGRDCVGALQFIPQDLEVQPALTVQGRELSDAQIEEMLKNLGKSPLALDEDADFRISLAGVQEKTALLHHQGKWLKPIGTTPTTHIFKPQIGHLPHGIDLSNSVENEFYCLKLLSLLGLPVNNAEISTFGETRVLVVERFDRVWRQDQALVRLPQEDCCQALSIPPSHKYQDHGGPGMLQILKLLSTGARAMVDQQMFLKCQMAFWLIGATDGHAKNFSIFLRPNGEFQMTPFYDVLTAQPSLDAGQIQIKQMRMAMSVGNSRHYKFHEISGRHFVQTARKAGMADSLIMSAIESLLASCEAALVGMESYIADESLVRIHLSVSTALHKRMPSLELGLRE